MELKEKTAGFFDMAVCNLADSSHGTGATCFLHLQGLNFRTTTKLHGVTFSKKTQNWQVTAAITPNLSILPLRCKVSSVVRLIVKAELPCICIRETYYCHFSIMLSPPAEYLSFFPPSALFYFCGIFICLSM